MQFPGTGTAVPAYMAGLFIHLRDLGIEPTRFARQEITLDDVFFKILEDANEEREDRHASAR